MIKKTNFIDSVIQKINLLFYNKKINKNFFLYDEDEEMIDNVFYMQIDSQYVGIYINGSNPLFTSYFINEIDSFNLYENYKYIEPIEDNLNLLFILKILLIFNLDYNELIGMYFYDEKIGNSKSFIFQEDSIIIDNNIDFHKFTNKVNENLMHIKNVIIYEKSLNKDWLVYSE